MELLFVFMFFGVIALVYRFRDRSSEDFQDEPIDEIEIGRRSGGHPVHPKPFNPNTAITKATPETLRGPARIIDGDSIVINKTQIRLFGVDAPEIDHPYGQKAKWALVRLCKGHTVRAEILEKDTHGRTVAKCFLEDGRDLSAEMVKQGLAIDWPKFSGGRYRHLEVADARKKMWLADARQKGKMYVWEKFEAQRKR